MAQQVQSEIVQFLAIVKGMAPLRVLEIGTSRGGTLFLLCRHAHPSARVFSLDLPGGTGGSGYALYRIPLYKAFALPNQKLHLLRGDSHQEAMAATIKHMLGNHQFDLLFIDGDHSYEGVRRDYDLYAPLVRQGGIIALHDIAAHPLESAVGVPRFWSEMKIGRLSAEFVEDRNQGWGGIGIIYAKSPPPS